MSVVCGLDLSLTSAGIAILRDGRPTFIRSIGHGGHNGANHEHRSRRITSQYTAVIDALEKRLGHNGLRMVDLAVIEDQLEHGPMLPSALDRSALWWGIYSALLAKRIPVAVINPMTLKLWFTGAGNATKLRMLDTARARFREPITTSDEADAVGLACAGAWRLGDPIPWEPGQRSVEALGKAAWPEVVGA